MSFDYRLCSPEDRSRLQKRLDFNVRVLINSSTHRKLTPTQSVVLERRSPSLPPPSFNSEPVCLYDAWQAMLNAAFTLKPKTRLHIQAIKLLDLKVTHLLVESAAFKSTFLVENNLIELMQAVLKSKRIDDVWSDFESSSNSRDVKTGWIELSKTVFPPMGSLKKPVVRHSITIDDVSWSGLPHDAASSKELAMLHEVCGVFVSSFDRRLYLDCRNHVLTVWSSRDFGTFLDLEEDVWNPLTLTGRSFDNDKLRKFVECAFIFLSVAGFINFGNVQPTRLAEISRKKVIVVGGGAAGRMAASRLISFNYDVVLLSKHPFKCRSMECDTLQGGRGNPALVLGVQRSMAMSPKELELKLIVDGVAVEADIDLRTELLYKACRERQLELVVDGPLQEKRMAWEGCEGEPKIAKRDPKISKEAAEKSARNAASVVSHMIEHQTAAMVSYDLGVKLAARDASPRPPASFGGRLVPPKRETLRERLELGLSRIANEETRRLNSPFELSEKEAKILDFLKWAENVGGSWNDSLVLDFPRGFEGPPIHLETAPMIAVPDCVETRTNAEVVAVRDSAEGVEVSLKDGSILKANACVLAVPHTSAIALGVVGVSKACRRRTLVHLSPAVAQLKEPTEFGMIEPSGNAIIKVCTTSKLAVTHDGGVDVEQAVSSLLKNFLEKDQIHKVRILCTSNEEYPEGVPYPTKNFQFSGPDFSSNVFSCGDAYVESPGLVGTFGGALRSAIDAATDAHAKLNEFEAPLLREWKAMRELHRAPPTKLDLLKTFKRVLHKLATVQSALAASGVSRGTACGEFFDRYAESRLTASAEELAHVVCSRLPKDWSEGRVAEYVANRKLCGAWPEAVDLEEEPVDSGVKLVPAKKLEAVKANLVVKQKKHLDDEDAVEVLPSRKRKRKSTQQKPSRRRKTEIDDFIADDSSEIPSDEDDYMEDSDSDDAWPPARRTAANAHFDASEEVVRTGSRVGTSRQLALAAKEEGEAASDKPAAAKTEDLVATRRRRDKGAFKIGVGLGEDGSFAPGWFTLDDEILVRGDYM